MLITAAMFRHPAAVFAMISHTFTSTRRLRGIMRETQLSAVPKLPRLYAEYRTLSAALRMSFSMGRSLK